MEPALRAVCKDVRIGKILIQTNLDSGEPEVEKMNDFYRLLPTLLIIFSLRINIFATFLEVIMPQNHIKLNVLIVFVFFHMMCVSVVTTLPAFVTMVTCLLPSGLVSCITCVCPKTSVKIMSS